MVPDQVRAFVRRHPAVRRAARRIRVHLPERLGGIDPDRLPPNVRRFDLALPVRDSGPLVGPESLEVRAPGDFWVAKRLAERGLAGYEPETLACFLAALEHSRPGAVLDIGANIGVYAALAAARTYREVYAFEPTPDVAAAARAIAAGNGLGVHVEELALSNHSGTASLRLSATTDASNSLAAGFRREVGRIPVRLDTLARWRERAGIVPAVIKIDTETTEPDVIAGGLEVLRRFRPWVFCEVLPDRGVEERLMALLEPLDYGWYHLSGPPPHPPRPVITGRGSGSRDRMWMFAPETPPPGFWRAAGLWRSAIDACLPRT
ncbi:FkbM family methyltransferase [Marinitenerispora sediminis]|uniref:FkbM family methyltransferase n=1 Tax=Marinitenerispora sediminis TaxID=1931232 RepID=A0A368TBA1_9ACTN|nr:FkbM family methyltransferase [Marinitenerispora sediminis]RCV54387.1 FkbM family methyltransferase [Marinitenerispora sediminis]RCV61116.1 FkbM family methyltransferase [Marinitenerispora sediminis]RCV62392.1 FkbM family methyltransferase [Marinitenerispora sediminis]